jgi:hypothetical protein
MHTYIHTYIHTVKVAQPCPEGGDVAEESSTHREITTSYHSGDFKKVTEVVEEGVTACTYVYMYAFGYI